MSVVAYTAMLGILSQANALCFAQDKSESDKQRGQAVVEQFDAQLQRVLGATWSLFPFWSEREKDLARFDSLRFFAEKSKDTWVAAHAYVMVQKGLSSLLERHPDDPSTNYIVAVANRSFANFLMGIGEKKTGAQLNAENVEAMQKLVRRFPKDLAFQSLLAHLHIDRGDWLLDDPESADAAIPDFKKAIEILSLLVKQEPTKVSHRIDLAHALSGLGSGCLRAGRYDEAREAHRSAFEIRERLANDEPANALHWVDLGGSCCNLGNVIVERKGKLDEATPLYEKAIVLLEKARKLDPNSPFAREYLANCYWGKFLVAVRTRRLDEADVNSNKSIELREPRGRRHHEIMRELEFAEVGEHERAAKRIEPIGKQKDLEPSHRYWVAWVYAAAAKAAKNNNDLADAYARQAVEHLRQFHKVSRLPAKSIQDEIVADKMFDPIRDREIFKSWLKELKESSDPKRDKR